MKKVLVIIVIATTLGSCAAERRLARFLQKHPELAYTDTIIQHDSIFIEKQTASTTITLSELLAMDSIASAAKEQVGTQADPIEPTVSASTDRSEAAIKAKGDKTFEIQSTALPDTIVLTDTVFQPHYITEYKDKEVEVYKQRWWQEILTSIGMISLIVIVIYVITKTIIKTIKRI